MIFRGFTPFIFCILIASQISWAGEIFDSIRDHVNQSWYNLAVGDCANADKNVSKFQKSQFKCYLQSNGYSKLAGFDHAEQLKDLNQDLREKLFFDAVVVDEAKRNSCQYDVWSSLSQKPADPKNIQASNKALSQQHIALKDRLKLTITGDASKAKEAQTLVIKKMIEIAKDIVENEKKIKLLNRSTKNYDEIQKLRILDDMEEEAIPYAQDEDTRDFFKNEILMPMKIDAFKRNDTDEDALIAKLNGTGSHSFQTLVVDQKLKKIEKEQSNMADTKGTYSDQHSYKVAAFANGDAERMLYTSGSDKPDFSSLSCQMQSKYGIGSDIATLAGTSAITVASALMGPAAAVAVRLAQSGVLVARSEALLTTAVKGMQYATAGADLGQAVLHDCVNNAAQANFSECSAAEEIKKNSAAVYVNKDISNANCVMNSVLGLMNLRGAMAASQSLKEKTAAEIKEAADPEENIRKARMTYSVDGRRYTDVTQRPKIKTVSANDISVRESEIKSQKIELPEANPGDKWGIDPNTNYEDLQIGDPIKFKDAEQWGIVEGRKGNKLLIKGPNGKLFELDLDETVTKNGFVWHYDIQLGKGKTHSIKVIDGVNRGSTLSDSTEMDYIKDYLSQLPAKDLDAVDTIRLQPYSAKGDSAIVGSVRANASGEGSKTMDFYLVSKDKKVSLDTMLHEFAHQAAKKSFKDVTPPKLEWGRAMATDLREVSEYAKGDLAEDFAETSVLYFLAGDRPDLRETFKGRFAYLDKMFLENPSLKEQMLQKLKDNQAKLITGSGVTALAVAGKVYLFPDKDKK